MKKEPKIRAYEIIYLEQARGSLGLMLDFAVYDLGFELTEFYDLFLRSEISRRFEHGDCSIVAGRSGYEIAYEVLFSLDIPYKMVEPKYTANRSVEYWTGWALAYYQWYTAMSFSHINKYIPIEKIAGLYNPYHEMDIMQFVDCMNELYLGAKTDTNLKIRRQRARLSQNQLGELAGS